MKKVFAFIMLVVYLGFFMGILAGSHSSGHHYLCEEKGSITANDHADTDDKSCCDFNSVKDKLKLHDQSIPSFFKLKISPALRTSILAFFAPLSFKERTYNVGYKTPNLYQSTYLKNRTLLI